MREIKFRAWDKGNNEMFIPYSIEFGKNRVFKDPTSLVYFKNVGLMECTGLKDLKGNEIYEGDILSNDEECYKVVFENGSYRAEYADGFEDYSLDLIDVAHCCEIVGNIYENPELLED